MMGAFSTILFSNNRSSLFVFWGTCFLTKSCIRSCPTKRYRATAGEFTPENSTVESANFLITGGRGAGEKRICRASCANVPRFVRFRDRCRGGALRPGPRRHHALFV